MNYPRLIADIGGTNARFAIETTPFELTKTAVLACADYNTLLSAINAYLIENNVTLPNHVGIAIANPVNGDSIKMTNHHWQFSISETKAELGVHTLLVINDFTAQALAITQMPVKHLEYLNGSKRHSPLPNDLACAVIGPGTGLGVSGLIPDGRGNMIALAGEGGHATFAPANDTEQELLNHIAIHSGGHVSVERLLQGQGLAHIYVFLAKKQAITPDKETPAEITQGAVNDKDPLCLATLEQYCAILGGACANVALTLGAIGGVYIAGGIVPRFTDFVRKSSFRERFEAKGRFRSYLQDIPAYVVEHEQPGLLGAAVGLNNHLK